MPTDVKYDPIRNVHSIVHTGDGWRMSFIVCRCGKAWSSVHYPSLRQSYELHILESRVAERQLATEERISLAFGGASG